jgi:hypothetical protein
MEGKINRDLAKDTVYQIVVTKEGYEAKMEDLEMKCSSSDCSACLKVISLTMVPVEPNSPVCPVGMNGEIKVVDELTKDPVVGAIINVVENENITVVTVAETNYQGIVTIPLTTNGNYTINITKDGYEPTMVENVEENCTLSVVAELSKPVCHTENVTITFNVHIRENVTDDGIEGASVDIFVIGQSSPLPINSQPLITDVNGKVALNISNEGTYKVAVSAEGMYSQQSDTVIVCDKSKCENCNPLAIVEMNKVPVPPPCNETKLAVETLDIVTKFGVNAQVTITFIPEHNDTVTDDDVKIVMADKSQDGANGNMLLPIAGNGKYIVFATAEGYLDNTETVVVNCSRDDCSACSPSITILLTEDICMEIELLIKITDAATNAAIEDAIVTVKLKTNIGSQSVAASTLNTDSNTFVFEGLLGDIRMSRAICV